MLLVMSTAGIFHDDGDAEANADRSYTALWQVSWERIDCFLPNLKRDLFLNRARASSPRAHAAAVNGKPTVETPVAVDSPGEAVAISISEDKDSEGKVDRKSSTAVVYTAVLIYFIKVAPRIGLILKPTFKTV